MFKLADISDMSGAIIKFSEYIKNIIRQREIEKAFSLFKNSGSKSSLVESIEELIIFPSLNG